jgi:hypothetical protein
MRHDERPKTIPEAVHAASFPVYGLADHPLDLFVSSHGLGISHLGNLMHICLVFTSPRYSNTHPYNLSTPQSKNFEVLSIDAAAQLPEREHMVFDLDGHVFADYTKAFFQAHHCSEKEQKQAGDLRIWEGVLSLTRTSFTGKVLYWESPLQISTFFLKSEETILMGGAFGPSYEELVQLLEGLLVINDRDDLLRQYQNDFEKRGSK